MKNLYLFIAFFFLTTAVMAQITLTLDDNTPQVDDSFEFYIIPGATLAVDNDGSDQTWDLSGLSGTSSVINYVSLSASSNPSEFPAANLVESFASSGAENYYNKTSSEYFLEGHYIPGSQIVKYSDKREFMKFPMSYGDSYSETFGGTNENLISGQIIERGGTLEISGSGYGDLILPYGTVNNVLKVSVIAQYDDEYLGYPLATYTDTVIFWYNASTRIFLASYSVSYIDFYFLAGSSAFYIAESDVVTSIDTEIVAQKNPVSFYPNPTIDQIVLDIAEGVESVSLYNVVGQKVKIVDGSEFSQPIQVSDLSPGMYILEVITNSGVFSDRLIKQ